MFIIKIIIKISLNTRNKTTSLLKDTFIIHYCLCIIDQTIESLDSSFEKYIQYLKIFWIFSIESTFSLKQT